MAEKWFRRCQKHSRKGCRFCEFFVDLSYPGLPQFLEKDGSESNGHSECVCESWYWKIFSERKMYGMILVYGMILGKQVFSCIVDFFVPSSFFFQKKEIQKNSELRIVDSDEERKGDRSVYCGLVCLVR